MATIRMILSLPLEEEKSQNPVRMKENSLFGSYSFARLPFDFADIARCHPATGWRLSRRQYCAGQNALFNLTDTTYNTAVGWFSLKSNLTGNLNTAIGAGTFLSNTADNNTDTGAGALLNNNAHEQHGQWSVRPF